MRVAAIYDIHGNLPALEAVISELGEQVDHIVVGGDVVPGPMPRETIDCLRNLEVSAQFIQGNGEAAVLADLVGEDIGKIPEQAREAVHWVAHQFRPEDRKLIESWPKTLQLRIDGLGDVLFCHGTPRSDTEMFTRLTSEDRLAPMFQGINASLVVCGHTHMQFDRMVGSTRVVNAGSVGMPFGEPGADWLLLGPDVQLRRTKYDLDKAAERVRQTTYPHAEHFAAHNILQPPTEKQMLELFSRAELR